MANNGGKRHQCKLSEEDKETLWKHWSGCKRKKRSYKKFLNKERCEGCVLNPTLFNIYIADIDRELEKRGVGGISIGNKRISSLAYEDDMVFLAKNKEALKDMMDVLKDF